MKADRWPVYEAESTRTIDSVDQAFERVQRLAGLVEQVKERSLLSKTLSLSTDGSDEQVQGSITWLPPAKNSRFYDRDDIIGRMDNYLRGPRNEPRVHSLALYGLGGVGKSHVALKYAHTRSAHYSAILWIHSASPTAIAQSFTDIALLLKLPQAERSKPEENRLLLLGWLQRTSKSVWTNK